MPSFDFEGKPISILPGDTVASALYRSGVRVFSRSFKYHRVRGLYCVTGDCANCSLTVDGEPAVRACCTPARAGQRVTRVATGWPSVDLDLLSGIRYFSQLFPVGFYYKTFIRPSNLWPFMDRLIRRAVGLGNVPREPPFSRRECCHYHPGLFVAGGGIAGLAAARAAAAAGRTVVLADEGEIGEKLARGPLRDRVLSLVQELRAFENVTILERATVVGIYEGPLVPVAGEHMLHLVHPERIVVAIGAVEQHAVFPGNDLPGIWLGRGAARMAGVHGIAPGSIAVCAGEIAEIVEHVKCLSAAGVRIAAALVPDGLSAALPAGVRVIPNGRVIEARGSRRVRAVIVESNAGMERVPCDTVVFSLGLCPRDGLLRQAPGSAVVGAGDVVMPGCTLQWAEESGARAAAGTPATRIELPLPSASARGFVCTCEDVTAGDLVRAWDEGFQSTELLKRYTTLTMGPCQGALCHQHLRAFVHARSGTNWTSAATVARPPARPMRLEDAAAGRRWSIERRTGLHERHVGLGAQMQWAGGWKRPQTYGDRMSEYWAVRRGVSIMDVGTLGKMLVNGRDARDFLDRIYPCHVRGYRRRPQAICPDAQRTRLHPR